MGLFLNNNYLNFVGTFHLLAWIVAILIYLKGVFAPNKDGEHGRSGNLVMDFYWGIELYPRLSEWFDIKMFTNCRFGMMFGN
jgi:7-dehydrocholesterol reductase